MIEQSLAERILRGEHLELMTFDENTDSLRELSAALSRIGRSHGVHSHSMSHPTKRGDHGYIDIESVPEQFKSPLVSILQQSPLLITLKTDPKVEDKTHP